MMVSPDRGHLQHVQTAKILLHASGMLPTFAPAASIMHGNLITRPQNQFPLSRNARPRCAIARRRYDFPLSPLRWSYVVVAPRILRVSAHTNCPPTLSNVFDRPRLKPTMHVSGTVRCTARSSISASEFPHSREQQERRLECAKKGFGNVAMMT
jgi:hypothetical protein